MVVDGWSNIICLLIEYLIVSCNRSGMFNSKKTDILYPGYLRRLGSLFNSDDSLTFDKLITWHSLPDYRITAQCAVNQLIGLLAHVKQPFTETLPRPDTRSSVDCYHVWYSLYDFHFVQYFLNPMVSTSWILLGDCVLVGECDIW